MASTCPEPATGHAIRPLSSAEADRVERLILRHRPLLKRLCRAQTGRREDAEDLEATVVMTACRRFSTFDPMRGAFGTWLGTIVRNEAADFRRRQARQPVCVPRDEASEAAIERAVARSYEPSPLPEVPELSRLPELLRQAFLLVKLGGLSSAEAAREMGTTDGTVRTYVWKARRLLRGWMGVSTDLPEEGEDERIGLGGAGQRGQGSGDGRR